MNSLFRRNQYLLVCLLGSSFLVPTLQAVADGKKPSLPAKPPKRAIILFNGKDSSGWEHRRQGMGHPCEWIVGDGALEVKPGSGDLVTKQQFQDFELHLEFKVPLMPDAHGQGRGNSGIYLHGLYEIQVLDSYKSETYADGLCGAIYGLKAPDKNVCKPPEQWQSYDITFYAPDLDTSGKVVISPRVSVLQNGVKIHENVEITGGSPRFTLPGPIVKTGPILLQDHGCKVRYRNIWLVPIKKGK